MKPEKVIEELYYTLHRADYSIAQLKHYTKAFDIAKSAIERCMIAKEPDLGMIEDDDGEAVMCDTCPNCGEPLWGFEDHCCDCGQLLDREE